MVSPLKISAKVEIDASQTAQGSAAATAAIGGIGKAADQVAAKLRGLDDAADGLAANGNGAGSRVGPLTAEGKALDELRAKYNPLYATMRTYNQEVIAIKAAHVAGALSVDEMTAALNRQRIAAMASMEALNGRNAAIRTSAANVNVRGGGAQQANTANIAAQFQDIGVTAAMGMSPLQIALQQGTQLSAVIGSMDKPVQGLASAFTSIINPISLITIGAVAAAAATIQYFGSAADKGKTLEAVLDDQTAALKRVRDLWGQAAEERSKYGRVSTTSASFGLDTSISAMLKKLREANEPTTFGPGAIKSAITTSIDDNLAVSGLSNQEFRGTSIFKTLQIDFQALQTATVKGRPDVLGLIRNLEAVGEKSSNAALKKMAQDAIEALQPFRQLAEALREAEFERSRLFADRGANGMLLSRGTTNTDDAGNLALYQSRVRKQLEDEQKVFDAEQARANAKSPAEKAAAARLSASVQRNDDENPEQRRQRIELAGKAALLQAEKDLKDAQVERGRALENSIERQQMEASLIGKTVGEQERLRMEYQLITELKAQAARTGVPADQAEIARIKEKAAAYGKLAEQIAAQKALLDADRSIAGLQTQITLIGQSEEVRTRILRQLETENRIRDLGLAKGSAEAEQLRQKAALAGELSDQIKKQEAAWEKVRSTGENTIDSIVDAASKGDFKSLLGDVAKDWSKSLLEMGVTNPLKNAALGTNKPTIADAGGLGGIVSKLFGGGAGNVAAMTVTAGTVMVNGGIGTGVGIPGLPTAANDNGALGNPVGSVTRAALGPAGSALGFVGNYKAGVDQRLTDILDTAAKQFPGLKVDATSGFRAGDPRFHGKGLATDVQLTDLLSGRKLGNYQDAGTFGTYEKFAQTARQVQMEKYPELSEQFRWGGYFSGGKGKYGAVDNMHFDLAGKQAGMGGGSWQTGLNSAQRALWPEAQSQGMETAAKAIEKITAASSSAATGLGTLGNGLGTFGNALTTGVSSASTGGGGGLFGWIGSAFSSLFGGTSGAKADPWAGMRTYAKGGISDRPAIFGEGPTAEAAVPLPDGRSIPVNMNIRQAYPTNAAIAAAPAATAYLPPIINNYGSQTVEHETRTDERGGRQDVFTISEAVSSGLSAKGGAAQKTMSRVFGVGKRRIAR